MLDGGEHVKRNAESSTDDGVDGGEFHGRWKDKENVGYDVIGGQHRGTKIALQYAFRIEIELLGVG